MRNNQEKRTLRKKTSKPRRPGKTPSKTRALQVLPPGPKGQVRAPASEAAKIPSIRKTGPLAIEVSATKTLDELLANLCALTGTRTNEVAIHMAGQAVDSLHAPLTDGGFSQAINMIAELAPQTATEAMLAVQTIATHEAALMFLKRATIEGQTLEDVDANVLRSSRFMRLFLEQTEAMQKLKGKSGQQRVVVEHVNVLAGGQAIVGAVSATKGEGGGGQ